MHVFTIVARRSQEANLFVEMSTLSEGLTQVLIPVAALVGIVFALIQWFMVSKVTVSNESSNGFKDRLIEADEEEEGVDNLEVSIKCAEIQNAISVGELSFSLLSLIPGCLLLGFLCLFELFWIMGLFLYPLCFFLCPKNIP